MGRYDADGRHWTEQLVMGLVMSALAGIFFGLKWLWHHFFG